MTIPSRRSTEWASAARRRSVSRFPKPASTSRRAREASSKVQLPELPDARMLTRRLMDSPPNLSPSTHAGGPQSPEADIRLLAEVKSKKYRGRTHHRKSAGHTSTNSRSFVIGNISRRAGRALDGNRRGDQPPWRQFCEARRIRLPFAVRLLP